MRIAIIGAGHVGSALAHALVNAGHSVRVSAKHPDHAREVAASAGATAASSNVEAVKDSDVVILAVKASDIHSVAREIADAARGKTVIDPSNPVNADMTGITSERSGAEEIQDLLPGAHVVKAFNTIFATHQADPVVDGEPLDAFYAGDDAEAKAQVALLLKGIGYRPIDAGPLKMARVLEDMEVLNIRLNAMNNWTWQTEWKLVGPMA